MTLRKSIIALLVTLGIAAPCLALEIGQTPQNFSLDSNRGTQFNLSELKGKVVYVDFWASWCSSCKASMPWLNKLQNQLGDSFQVVAVNLDEQRETAQAFLQKSGVNLLVAYDPAGTIPEQFGVQAMPTSFLLDKNGKVAFIHEGFNSKDSAELEAKIREVVSSSAK